MKYIAPILFILSSKLYTGDTGLIKLKGIISNKINETHVLTIDQYGQKVWVPRKRLEDIKIKLIEGEPYALEVLSSNVIYEDFKATE